MPDVGLLPPVIAQSPSHGLHSVTLSFTHTITGACLAAVGQGVREHRNPCLQILNSMEPSVEQDLPEITAGCAVIKWYVLPITAPGSLGNDPEPTPISTAWPTSTNSSTSWRTSNPAMEMEFIVMDSNKIILGVTQSGTSFLGRQVDATTSFNDTIEVRETSASGHAAKSGSHFTRGILIAYPYPPSGRSSNIGTIDYMKALSLYAVILSPGTQRYQTNGKAYAQQSQKFMRSAGFSPGILQQMISACVLW
ncbi:hypothetical protein C7212DRAFT_343011 [Tuber magnatum]|uniref:Uncharacterized protein n=1 Tax=Tuber magnatum TaxID=42249 RepID=A0A317SRY6_9PEZI|nr:hypothetical protein C7212DRAFT_343011 [Tuber magnatum]